MFVDVAMAEEVEKFEWRGLAPVPVIGVDEAGVGSLAGPVYAAAVVLTCEEGVDEFRDSKLLTALQRDRLFELIRSHHLVGIGRATVKEIDRYNIRVAAVIAMRRAVRALELQSGHLLVDGNVRISKLNAFSQTTLVKADRRAAPVSAASIAAKVSRDRYMRRLARRFPDYHLEKHKGYATALHREVIGRLGPTSIHRASFVPRNCVVGTA